MRRQFIWHRKVCYFWEYTFVKLLIPIILFLVDTPITPNMVTFFNCLVIVPLFIFGCVMKWYMVIPFVLILYLCFDIIDGNLARNKNMCSLIGAKVDVISDMFLYIIGFGIMGWFIGAPVYSIVGYVVIYLSYASIATYYIVPNIRKNPRFQNTRIKTFFMKKGIILGMDIGFQDVITAVLLFTSIREYILLILSLLWFIDLLYRLYELKIYN